MSKPEKKPATVTTGKVKDIVATPEVKQAFGGEPDDTVVSIKLPKGSTENVVQPGSYLEAWVDKNGGEVRPIPEGTPPTDRQIQNAERILKAAGRDMNRKLGTVIVNGVEIEPIATGIKIELSGIRIKELGDEMIYPQGLNAYRVSDREFKLFQVDYRGRQVYYLIDAESNVELSGESRNGGRDTLNYLPHVGSGLKGLALLVSASSVDDTIIGDVSLVNVNSKNNVLNSSALIVTEEAVRHYEYGQIAGFEASESEGRPWIMGGKKIKSTKNRVTVADSQFKRSTVTNSVISQGSYCECQINLSSIEGSGFASMTQAYLEKTTLTGTRISVKHSNLGSCSVRSETELLIKYSVFNHLSLSSKNVHILNKFNFLSLDTPTNKMYLVRASKHEFDLGTSVYRMKRLKLSCTEEEVRKVVAEMMTYDEEGLPVAETSITRSFGNYITESVMSRLKVIKLIDEAKQLVNDVGLRRHSWEDMYSL